MASVVDLSRLDKIPGTCILEGEVLDCGQEEILLNASTKMEKLRVKAAYIEIQGKILGEELDLEATGDLVLKQGAHLFLAKKSSFYSRREIQVHGGLFASRLKIVGASVLFSESSDVQVQHLDITSSDFKTKNRLIAQNLKINLSNSDKKRLSSPYGELGGSVQAKVLNILGPGSGSRLVIRKQSFVDAEHIHILTKSYLNFGYVRFALLSINGQDHASYGKTSGGKYEAAAENIRTHEGSLYQIQSAQIWGYDCKDEGKWNVENTLGLYCQTMTAGPSSAQNTLYNRTLDAQNREGESFCKASASRRQMDREGSKFLCRCDFLWPSFQY